MNTTVIDTLRFADRLKEAGFEVPRAEGLARALGDELAEQMVTKRDLEDALHPIRADIKALDAKFEAKFDALETRFDAIDSRFESNDARFDANDKRFDSIDARFDANDKRFDSIDARFDANDKRFDSIDARFEALDTKIDSVHRELTGKFNILVSVMVLGFSLLAGLEGYSVVSTHLDKSGANSSDGQQALERSGPAFPSALAD